MFPVRCNNNKTLTEMIMQIYNKYMCERLSGVVFRSFFSVGLNARGQFGEASVKNSHGKNRNSG